MNDCRRDNTSVRDTCSMSRCWRARLFEYGEWSAGVRYRARPQIREAYRHAGTRRDRPATESKAFAPVQRRSGSISTIKQLMCLDLATEKILWERVRRRLRPDGDHARWQDYLPSLEGPHWYVDAQNGEVLCKIVTDSGAP